MRRTSRLVLLLGVFLAALTFVVVLFLGGNQGGGPTTPAQSQAPTQMSVVVALTEIPLGTVLTAENAATYLTTRTLAVPAIETNTLLDTSQALGKTTRANIVEGQQVHSTDFQNRAVPLSVPTGKRAFPVQVNELTGVLNLLDVGDNIDLLISLRGDAFPVVQVLADGSVTVVSGINPLSVKLPLLLQDIQIIAVLDPPAPAVPEGQAPAASQKPTITGANKLLVLAVTPAQAEVLLFARTTGTLDAILRPPSDAGQTVDTTGVILKTLVDAYGVLPPEIVQVPIPTPLRR